MCRYTSSSLLFVLSCETRSAFDVETALGERGCPKRDGGTTSQGKEPATEVEKGGEEFVTMGGVGFKGDFGVGCADSSTLSSVPRSTGGYASLHTFTFVRVRAHTHARDARGIG